MEEYGYISSIVAGVFYLIASARLLRLSRRTGERPELLFGIYFAFSGVYYVAYNMPSLLGIDDWSVAGDWIIEWIYILGVFPYLIFIRSVFRPGEVWAALLVGFCSVLLLLGTALGGVGGHVAFSLDNPWFLPQWVGYTVPCVWMCWESMLARQGAKKRARLGLSQPLVVNRYLLMALFGAFQSVACLADLSFARDVSDSQAVSLITNLALGCSEISSVAVLWLAFFPPVFYTNWVTRRNLAPSETMNG